MFEFGYAIVGDGLNAGAALENHGNDLFFGSNRSFGALCMAHGHTPTTDMNS